MNPRLWFLKKQFQIADSRMRVNNSVMPLRVLIVPDKFKGTLTAQTAAGAIAQGWRESRPADKLELLPMSDGGDGFGEIISGLLGAKPQTVSTIDAAHQRLRATWWWEPNTKTAIVESAKVIGLALLPSGKYHPFQLDTLGLGAVLRAASEKGARRCLIGIGGSATNDGGFGLARALGWQFFDQNERPIKRWTELSSLTKMLPPRRRKLFAELAVAVDVQNRLLGPRGATRVYGPQKGLRPEDFPLAERCLRRLASVARKQLHRDFAAVPGTGAAGGLGFGLLAFLGARAESGVELFSRYAKLEQRLRTVDLVITGEGAIDKSTLMGKGVGEIARLCGKLGLPCLGLAGKIGDLALVKKRFTQVHGLTPRFTSQRKAKTQPAFWLKQLAMQVARKWR